MSMRIFAARPLQARRAVRGRGGAPGRGAPRAPGGRGRRAHLAAPAPVLRRAVPPAPGGAAAGRRAHARAGESAPSCACQTGPGCAPSFRQLAVHHALPLAAARGLSCARLSHSPLALLPSPSRLQAQEAQASAAALEALEAELSVDDTLLYRSLAERSLAGGAELARPASGSGKALPAAPSGSARGSGGDASEAASASGAEHAAAHTDAAASSRGGLLDAAREAPAEASGCAPDFRTHSTLSRVLLAQTCSAPAPGLVQCWHMTVMS